MISRHYVKPEVSVHSEGVDLVVVSKNNTELESIECFVKGILLPYAQNSCNCSKCKTKKRPSFCTHKKAVA